MKYALKILAASTVATLLWEQVFGTRLLTPNTVLMILNGCLFLPLIVFSYRKFQEA
jgi:hypothetical protein